MKWLAFERAHGARRVRAARFESRSSLPVSAASLVANSAREALSALFGAPVGVRLFEPSIPTPEGWAAIAAGAMTFCLRGDRADAAIVLRPRDARALADAAFGERGSVTPRPLSAIESDVVERVVRALAPSLIPVCGTRERGAVERIGSIAGFTTYFELLTGGVAEARIGVALSREPDSERGATLAPEDLAGVRLRPRVCIAMGRITAAEAAALEIGDLVPIPSADVFRGRLQLSGRTLALGTCGVRDGRYAFLTTGGGQ